jgi:multimeric flavodoxin WrbA
MPPRRFLFVIASTRRDGNSERLARRAAAGLPAHAETKWIRLDEYPLPPFRDTRHDVGFAAPEGHAAQLAEATLWATDLVFVTPTYWYALPAEAKSYLDHWTVWLRVPALAFKESMKGRALWAIVVDSDEPGQGSSDPVIGCLQKTTAYMEMRWGGLLLGHGNRPGDVEKDTAAWHEAEAFFRIRGV